MPQRRTRDMDKELIRQRFAKASGSYDTEASIQRDVAGKMIGLIDRFVSPEAHRNVLEIGCGTGIFTRLYTDRYHPEKLWLNDLCPEMELFHPVLEENNAEFLPGDAENIILPEGLTLITSCSAIQWFEDPEMFFRNCFGKLEPGGYMAVSTFGKGNMKEISAVTGASLSYVSTEEMERFTEGMFETVHSGEECLRLHFGSPADVLRHIRKTGVTGIRKERWTKGTLSSFTDRYKELYGQDGRGVSLTYHPVYLILRKIG